MAVFVVLALALLVACTAAALVAGALLVRQVRGLRSAVDDAGSRLGSLAEELREEAAVASLEVEGLQRRVTDLGQGRAES